MSNQLTSVDSIIDLYKLRGKSDYIGEEISQIEHAEQSAFFAAEKGLDDEIIVAALLHDIGHLCDPSAAAMKDLGVAFHEKVGAKYLEACGLSSRVCRLVGHHVDAKRYLVGTKKNYKKKLSLASQKTLVLQGGAMTSEEASEFKGNSLFRDALAIRSFDEKAKLKDFSCPKIESYKSKIANCMR